MSMKNGILGISLEGLGEDEQTPPVVPDTTAAEAHDDIVADLASVDEAHEQVQIGRAHV